MNATKSLRDIGQHSPSILRRAGLFSLPVADPDNEAQAQAALSRIEADIVQAQSCGFGFAWLSEHHNSAYGGCIPDPLTLIAAIGQRLTAIELGTAVLLAPLRHPALITEQTRLVSRLIGRPVQLGLGRGFLPCDQADFGLSPEMSSKLFWEAVKAIAADGSRVQPTSAWVATTHPTGAEQVGQLGLGLALNPYTREKEETDASIDAYRRAFEAAGHTHSPRILIHEPLLLAERADAAREAGRRHFATYLGALKAAQTTVTHAAAEPRHSIGEEDYAARCPFDDADGFRRHIVDWVARGVTHWCFHVRFGDMPDDVTRATIERCAAVLATIDSNEP